MTTLLNPYFGEFGGMYVPQILMPALRQLEEAFVSAQKDPEFQAQFNDLLKNYAGRPTALTKCQNITAGTNTTLYLKREDLLHGGAHKTNQVLGQTLLAKRMGKTEIIAETGAGQHGVASALASALLGLKCRIYMGAKDVERQSPNVFRMRLMGAEVIPVHIHGAKTFVMELYFNTETTMNTVGKFTRSGSQWLLGAVHIQRQTDDDFVRLPLFQ